MAATKKTAAVKAESVNETVETVETAKKKAPVKKATATKKAVKNAMYVQFGGKSYAQEDLMKIAKDVWKYDLKQKIGDLKTVELYVKPEESKVYYVMNDMAGNFDI